MKKTFHCVTHTDCGVTREWDIDYPAVVVFVGGELFGEPEHCLVEDEPIKVIEGTNG